MAAPAETPRSIEFLEPSTLLIEWEDGHESLYSHRLLREQCECAACIDEWTRAPILDPKTLPADIHVSTVERTGRYGLNFHFSDGHHTGIYAFRALRRNCPCPECVAADSPSPPPSLDDSTSPERGPSR